MSKITDLQDARSAAVYIILQTQNQPVQAVLDATMRHTKLPESDTALCTELVYGYLRYALRIDVILDNFLKKRNKLPLEVQGALGLAVYALLFLKKVPAYATVDWTVGYIKKRYGLSLSRLANGVLRNVVRAENSLHEADFFGSDVSAFYAVPSWLYAALQQDHGHEACHQILTRSLQTPKASLRLNAQHTNYQTLRAALQEISSAQPVGFDGYVFLEGTRPKELCGISLGQWHDVGALSWQSAGSQEALSHCFSSVPILRNSPWWDACAGQGGKSFMLLEQGVSVDLASDTSFKRLRQLKATANRLALTPKIVICASAAEQFLQNWQGNILLDVPCSGLGTLARRPDMRKKRKQKDIDELCALQDAILENAWKMLTPSFFCVYMTCTVLTQENENRIASFIQKHSNASEVFTWKTPHTHEWLEGMFVSVLQKKG